MSEKFDSIEGYSHISTVVGKAQGMMDKVRSGELQPLQTSLRKEQEKIGGYYPSDQVVIAGRTGTGKSSKILSDLLDFCNFELNPTYKDDLIILLDSYEMADWRNVLRMISRKGEVEAKALLDYKKRLTEERYKMLWDIGNQFKHLPIYITNKPRKPHIWEEEKKQIQGKFPKKKIVNIYDHSRLGIKEDDVKKEEEHISGLMFRGIYLKNNFDMFMFWLSQMNRNIETNISRDKLGTYLPVSSDIFGSDAVFQCADIVYALHRPGMYGVEQFEGIPTGYDPSNPDKDDHLLIETVLKQREGWTGNILLGHKLAHNKVFDLEYTPESRQLSTKDIGDF